MTKEAAVLAITLALIAGYHWSRWQRAEATRRLAKAAADTAGKGAWRTRGVILLIGFAAFAVINLWVHGRGR
jgi:TnpA family transposase